LLVTVKEVDGMKSNPRRWLHRACELSAVISAIFIFLSLSCAGPTTMKETEDGYRGSTELHGSSDEADLELGKHYRTEGDYERATEAFLRVYENESGKVAHRSQALFELGKTYSDLLNPQKDYQKASFYFEKLLSDYPDSDLRKETGKQLDLIRGLQGFAPED
jgi:tetratricopeptide (TPR) repeat protein